MLADLLPLPKESPELDQAKMSPRVAAQYEKCHVMCSHMPHCACRKADDSSQSREAKVLQSASGGRTNGVMGNTLTDAGGCGLDCVTEPKLDWGCARPVIKMIHQ